MMAGRKKKEDETSITKKIGREKRSVKSLPKSCKETKRRKINDNEDTESISKLKAESNTTKNKNLNTNQENENTSVLKSCKRTSQIKKINNDIDSVPEPKVQPTTNKRPKRATTKKSNATKNKDLNTNEESEKASVLKSSKGTRQIGEINNDIDSVHELKVQPSTNKRPKRATTKKLNTPKNENLNTDEENVKTSILKFYKRTRQNRKINNGVDSVPEPKVQPTTNKRPKRETTKKSNATKNKDLNTNDENENASVLKSSKRTRQIRKINNNIASVHEPKVQRSTNKRSKRATTKKSVPNENEPKLKKAKVVLEKLAIKQYVDHSENENSSNSSADSGCLSVSVSKCKENLANVKSIKEGTPSFSNVIIPKFKKVKVVLEKLDIKQYIDHSANENSSESSADSGCLSDSKLNDNLANVKSIKVGRPSCSNLNSSGIGDDFSGSESEWEEVEENEELILENYNPVIPKGGVEITIDCPNLKFKRRKNRESRKIEWARQCVNRMRKEAQLNVHKCHLLFLLGRGLFVNNTINSSLLQAIALSLIPVDILDWTKGKKRDKIDVDGIERIVKWFRSSFSFEAKKNAFHNLHKDLTKAFETKLALNASEYNIMFIIIARVLGFKARFCMSLYPMSHKATNLIKKRKRKSEETSDPTNSNKEKQVSENVNKPASDIKPKMENIYEQQSNENEKCYKKNNKEISRPSDCDKSEQVSKSVNKFTSKVKPKKENVSKQKFKEKKETSAKKVQKSSSNNEIKVSRPRRSTGKNYKISSDESADEPEDEDFKIEEEEYFEEPKGYRKVSTKRPVKTVQKSSANNERKVSRPRRYTLKSYEVSSDESAYEPDDEDFKIDEEEYFEEPIEYRKISTKRPVKSVQKSSANKGRKVSRPRRSTGKDYEISSDESAYELEEEDFKIEEEEKLKGYRKISKKRPKQRTANRKILSEFDFDSHSPSLYACHHPDKVLYWVEVFSKPDKQWISVECVHNIVNYPYKIEAVVPQPVSYVVAFDNDSHIKDVTKRYCRNYMTFNIKQRVVPEWWDETLAPFAPPNSKLDKEEEKNLEMVLMNQPLPPTVSGFKNHPMYALKRHLLKYEALYPPDAVSVGFLRGEPVYLRENVVKLRSRETWLKEGRVVRIGEEPYKIVKSTPRWDKINRCIKTDLPPMGIFGFWQTEMYEPPSAVDGKIPRNEYGNVELFKPCMLPRGTVHIQLPGINRIAKKLGIDCAPAFVGFDGQKSHFQPLFDGFVVCEEFKDTILSAWDEEQENIRKREEEKREKRIYGHWKKLIRGLLIRERIKMKYDV